MFRNSSDQDQGGGSLQLAWIKGPDYCGTNENIMRLDAGKVTRRRGIDGRIRGAEAGSERQPRPADMRMQVKGAQGRYDGKEKKAPWQSSECKTKVETQNRQRDKEKEVSGTRREGRGKVGTAKAERGGPGSLRT